MEIYRIFFLTVFYDIYFAVINSDQRYGVFVTTNNLLFILNLHCLSVVSGLVVESSFRMRKVGDSITGSVMAKTELVPCLTFTI